MKVRIYTDGACSGNPGPGGWGAIVLLDDKIVELSGYAKETTNNRMELIAVLKSLKYCNEKVIEKATIYSDSAYVVNAVQKDWLVKWIRNDWKTNKGEVKNKDLWVALIKFLSLLKVEFVKVKGHSGDIFNNKADELARGEIQKNKLL